VVLLFDRSHEQHVGAFLAQLEVFPRVVFENRGRERTEPLAELDLKIHLALHVRIAGVPDDAARAERSRSELHAAAHDANHAPRLEQTDQLVV
jgi:hypothetical protein